MKTGERELESKSLPAPGDEPMSLACWSEFVTLSLGVIRDHYDAMLSDEPVDMRNVSMHRIVSALLFALLARDDTLLRDLGDHAEGLLAGRAGQTAGTKNRIWVEGGSDCYELGSRAAEMRRVRSLVQTLLATAVRDRGEAQALDRFLDDVSADLAFAIVNACGRSQHLPEALPGLLEYWRTKNNPGLVANSDQPVDCLAAIAQAVRGVLARNDCSEWSGSRVHEAAMMAAFRVVGGDKLKDDL